MRVENVEILSEMFQQGNDYSVGFSISFES